MLLQVSGSLSLVSQLCFYVDKRGILSRNAVLNSCISPKQHYFISFLSILQTFISLSITPFINCQNFLYSGNICLEPPELHRKTLLHVRINQFSRLLSFLNLLLTTQLTLLKIWACFCPFIFWSFSSWIFTALQGFLFFLGDQTVLF